MQKFLFPMKELRVTQKALSTYSHAGSLAMDFGGKDTGVSPLYAPCDLVVKRTRINENGEMYVESTEPVLFADGTTDYARLILIHTPTFLYSVGDIIPQGAHFYDEGGMGSGNPNAFAKHVHIEGGKGKWVNTTQTVNSQGTYCIENQYNLEKMFIVPSDTTIMDGQGYNWIVDDEEHVEPTRQFNCIDVSKHQGRIDWAKVKAAGYNQAIIRVGFAGYDGTIYNSTENANANIAGPDPYFHVHMQEAIELGIDVGVYVYSYVKTEEAAINSIRNTHEYIKDYNLTMPFAWDFEDSKQYASYGKDLNTSICRAAIDETVNLGYYPLLYSYTYFIQPYLDMSRLSDVDVWIADYRGYMGYTENVTMWQYTSDGRVDGIDEGTEKRVDLNYVYVNYPAIIGGETTPETEPTENKALKVSQVNGKDKMQAFNSKSVEDWFVFEDESVYLPVGEYKITYLETLEDTNGFKWGKIQYENLELWVVYNIDDGRCEIVEITDPVPEPDPEPECECSCESLKTQLIALGQEVNRLQAEKKNLENKINMIKEIIQ